MADYRVNLIAMIGGSRAQDVPGDEEPTDVWEDQSREYDEVEDAKSYVEGLDPRVSTHVVIEAKSENYSGWREIYVKDRGDDLDSAHVPTPVELEAEELALNPPPPEAPPTPMPAQEK